MRAAFLSSDDARWGGVLSGLRHDVYHRPEYLAFAARHQVRGEAVAYVAEADGQRLLVPLILTLLPGWLGGDPARTDASSPRGFPGPILGMDEGLGAADFADEALRSFVGDLAARGTVCAFIRTHPLLGPPPDVLRRHGVLVRIGDSFSVDLGRSDEELWQATRENHRRDITRAGKAGYTVRIDDGWDRLEHFVAVFQQTMARVGAPPHWILSREYFVDLRRALGDALHLCVVELDGALAAASLVTESDGIAEYHLAGTADAHVRASPSKLIIRFACTWARDRGNRWLHLAGSPNLDDSLAHFKAGFPSERHPMWTWRVVADQPAYDALVQGWEEHTGGAADAIGGYFPAYRRPPGWGLGDARA